MTDAADAAPFSLEVLELFQRLQRAKGRGERQQLTKELAERFAADHDSTDSTATDDYHNYFEEMSRAKLAYETACLRVGRLVVNCIQTYHEVSGTTPAEPEEPDDAPRTFN